MKRQSQRRLQRQRSLAGTDHQLSTPYDDGTVTTPMIDSTSVAMIQALIPLGLKAVEDALQQEVRSLTGARYAHADKHDDEPTGIARWGSQPGSVFLADQKLPIKVPRVRDVGATPHREIPLLTYQQLQTPRSADVGLFRRVLGGISCREYEAAAEAVPEAFGLAKSSVSMAQRDSGRTAYRESQRARGPTSVGRRGAHAKMR
ncbi:MAG TPA: hypothetical protein VFC39_00785 [Acidobacteriaceae bacterium]|nr:hypothetical protein [Acidobacteriaceae bacterium]